MIKVLVFSIIVIVACLIIFFALDEFGVKEAFIQADLDQLGRENERNQIELNNALSKVDYILGEFDACEDKYGCECVINNDGMVPKCDINKGVDVNGFS
jgi:hypothetical protein